MVIIFLFIAGLFLGSFINVLSDRLPRGESVIVGRSHCDYCKHTLSPFDLIPLFSFLFLRGKCRYCHKKLSIWYPVSEFAAAGVLIGAWWWVDANCTPVCLPYFGGFAVLFLSFFTLFIADMKYHILPDSLMVTSLLAIGAIRLLLWQNPPTDFGIDPNWVSAMVTGIALSVSFLVLFMVTRGHGMGFGDVKLAFIIGFLLGFPLGVIAIYLAFLTGGVVAVILLVGGYKKFGQHIAFGPFMIVGSVISLLYSTPIHTILQTLF